jgi:hypothetical protein
MRRLLLFLVVATVLVAQDLNYTKGQLNGLAWGSRTDSEKIWLLAGIQLGNHLVATWLLSDSATCREKVVVEPTWARSPLSLFLCLQIL